MKIFKDRESAGKILASKLKSTQANLVLGIPRGGVVVAKEISQELNLPLDIIVTRKIPHPDQIELALGAVDSDGEIILGAGLEIEGLEELVKKEVEEIKRREQTYRQGKNPLNLKGKTVILVDDGIATGLTTLATIKYLKKHKVKKIILAVPVASNEALDKIKSEVEKLVILETPEYFNAVGQFYLNFLPVSDQEVIQLLSDE